MRHSSLRFKLVVLVFDVIILKMLVRDRQILSYADGARENRALQTKGTHLSSAFLSPQGESDISS